MNPAEMAPINVERVRTTCIAISLNVQRRTLNAQRLMRELASSFHISLGRSDAREENFDELFRLVEDRTHFRCWDHR